MGSNYTVASLILALTALAACSDDMPMTDGGTDSGMAGPDTGAPTIDSGTPPADSGSPGDTGSPGADSGPPAPSDGCGRSPAPTGARSITMPGGGMRTFIVDLPSGYDADVPWPVVFGFHGATTSGETFRSRFYGNLGSTMGEQVILVHPDALPPGSSSAWDRDRDVPFFDAMLTQLSTDFCIDENRIFATGHSSGGFFTNELACDRGDVLAAIAPVSGGGPFVFGGRSCAGAVPAWIAHGASDDVVALDLGTDSRDFWAGENGCNTGSSTPTATAPCVAYTCSGERLEWCEYAGMHEWPAFAPVGIWEFFRAF